MHSRVVENAMHFHHDQERIVVPLVRQIEQGTQLFSTENNAHQHHFFALMLIALCHNVTSAS
jgi:hypothetical protein